MTADAANPAERSAASGSGTADHPAAPDDPVYPEDYYEHIARTLGEEQAAWARLPRAQREEELTRLHRSFNTPDDLAVWPPELSGGTEASSGA